MMSTRARAISTAISAAAVFFVARYLLIDYRESELYPLVLVVAYLIFAILLSVLVCWVLFFKLTLKSIIFIAAFPAVSMAPLWFLGDSIVSLISSTLGIGTVIMSLLLAIAIYLLVLTVNILNGARIKNIPLAQAAKAAHFLTILLSTYAALTLVLSGGLNLALAGIVLIIFMTYHVYSAISMQRVSVKQERLLVGLIVLTLTMVYYLLILWPLPVAYTTAIITITFYMLLNRALEVRTAKVGYLWLEYLLLFVLMAVILLTNASWGINGSII